MRLSAKIACIQMDGDVVRLVVVKSGGKVPTVLERSATRAVYESNEGRFEALAQAVRDVVARTTSRPTTFMLCADSAYSVVRRLTVPFRGRYRVASAVQFELEPYLAIPIDELIVDHDIVREVDGQSEVLIVGMRKAFLREQLAVLEAAGVDPEGIGVSAIGLTALWQAGRPPLKGLNAVLHIREEGAVLVVTYERSLAFFRHIPISAGTLREDPVRAAREVSNSLRAFQASWEAEERLEELSFTGADLGVEGRLAFEDAVHVAVAYDDLGECVVDKSKAGAGKGSSAVEVEDDAGALYEPAIGTALGAAGGVVALDFRRGELSRPKPWRHLLEHGISSTCLAALLLVGYIAYCYVDYSRNIREVDHISEEIWDLYSEAFPLSESVKGGRPTLDIAGTRALALMAQDYDTFAKSAKGFSVDLLSRPTLLDILTEINSLLSSEHVQVTNIRIPASRQRSQRIVIEGELKNPEAGRLELEKLKKSELLHVSGEFKISSKADKTEFTVEVDT